MHKRAISLKRSAPLRFWKSREVAIGRHEPVAALLACGGVTGTVTGGISVGGTLTGPGGTDGVGNGGPSGCGIGGTFSSDDKECLLRLGLRLAVIVAG